MEIPSGARAAEGLGTAFWPFPGGSCSVMDGRSHCLLDGERPSRLPGQAIDGRARAGFFAEVRLNLFRPLPEMCWGVRLLLQLSALLLSLDLEFMIQGLGGTRQGWEKD